MLGLFKRVPSSFLPEEDQGYIFAAVIMPDAASLDRTEAATDRAQQSFSKQPGGRRRGHRCRASA